MKTGQLSEHLNRVEFECNDGCGFDTVDAELVMVIERTRVHFGKPVYVNSGCRCYAHNDHINGSLNSQHIAGKAADIVIENVKAYLVADYLENLYDDRYGIGRYTGRTHIDVRKIMARWDKRR